MRIDRCVCNDDRAHTDIDMIDTSTGAGIDGDRKTTHGRVTVNVGIWACLHTSSSQRKESNNDRHIMYIQLLDECSARAPSSRKKQDIRRAGSINIRLYVNYDHGKTAVHDIMIPSCQYVKEQTHTHTRKTSMACSGSIVAIVIQYGRTRATTLWDSTG